MVFMSIYIEIGEESVDDEGGTTRWPLASGLYTITSEATKPFNRKSLGDFFDSLVGFAEKRYHQQREFEKDEAMRIERRTLFGDQGEKS